MALGGFFNPTIYPEPEGNNPPDGWQWDNSKGRNVNTEYEVRQPMVRNCHAIAWLLTTYGHHAGRVLALPFEGIAWLVQNWPEDRLKAGFGTSVVMGGGLDPETQTWDALDPASTPSDTKAARKQLDALIRANYGVQGTGNPFPILHTLYDLARTLAGQMLETQASVSWPEFELWLTNEVGSQQVFDQVDRIGVKSAYTEAGELETEGGSAMLKGEVLTALAEKLLPHLDTPVTSALEGQVKVATFALLLTFINIVANRYDLTGETG